MLEPLVFLTEPDRERMAQLVRALEAAEPISLETFNTITSLRRGLRARSPSLIIGPWAIRGETLLAARSVVRKRRKVGPLPQLLILADHITPAKIALAQSAGSADLIPAESLDLNAFLNRVILLVHGPDSLHASIAGDGARRKMAASLEEFPALRKRLAA